MAGRLAAQNDRLHLRWQTPYPRWQIQQADMSQVSVYQGHSEHTHTHTHSLPIISLYYEIGRLPKSQD